MTKKTRTTLFLILLFLFLLAAPVAILYSQGYRFDFERKKIVQTGAFYFKVWPQRTEIYLSGKLKKKTSLFGSAFLGNLLPKRYGIEVKKEGYYPWKKNLEIKEKQVTEAKNIILFPLNPKFEILDKEVKDFSFLLDEKETIPEEKIPLILEEPITYEILPDNIIWLAPDGFCYKSDFSGKVLEVLNLKPISVKTEGEYKIFNQNQNLFLKENSNLFYLDADSRNFEKIFDSFSNLKFSPDLKKIVFTNNFEIWLFNLKEEQGQPQRKAKEKVFLTRFSEKIDDIFWLNSNYLIFNTGNKIKVAEIDDRDRINIFDLSEIENPKISWKEHTKKLYLLSGGNLYLLENLVP